MCVGGGGCLRDYNLKAQLYKEIKKRIHTMSQGLGAEHGSLAPKEDPFLAS